MSDPGVEASPTNERAREGVAHLQAAARELIAAARAALDVAEDLVDDPDMAASMASTFGSLGDVLRQVTSSWLASTVPPGRTADGDGDASDDGESPGQVVERIVVE